VDSGQNSGPVEANDDEDMDLQSGILHSLNSESKTDTRYVVYVDEFLVCTTFCTYTRIEVRYTTLDEPILLWLMFTFQPVQVQISTYECS